MKIRLLLCASAACCALTASASAQPVAEQVVAYGTLASDSGLSPAKVPATVNSLSAADITGAHGAAALDSMATQVPGCQRRLDSRPSWRSNSRPVMSPQEAMQRGPDRAPFAFDLGR